MSNDRTTSPITVPASETRPRPGSIASGLPFNDLFSRQNSQAAARDVANAQASQRRFFANSPFRRGSLSSSWSSSANPEEAIAEDDGPSPSSPFARRVSFGANALREARASSIGNGRFPPAQPVGVQQRSPSSAAPARSPASTVNSTQDDKSNASRRLGEGFNWSEALRSRAERAPSIGGPISPSANRAPHHQRATSIASMESPGREIPRQPKYNKPDFFQEKILRGDFMD
ncbi:hypothetical protein N7470_001320 [Penicillium chermesinum]|nr:hypothetical protein N7470_001320 [Penicillium chermesinum]